MNKLKKELLAIATPDTHNWVEENRTIIAQIERKETEDEKLNDRIILRLIGFMRRNNMTQRDLASMLGVSPQYINKLLRGTERNIGVTTASRYGRILGIDLFGDANLTEYKSIASNEIASTTVIPSPSQLLEYFNNTFVSQSNTKRYSTKKRCYGAGIC